MTFLFYTSLVLFLLLCLLLCFIVLIQESKSLGLGASFGGDPGDSVFGTSTAEVLKKTTAYLAVLFVICCVLLSFWTNSMGRTRTHKVPYSIEETSGE